MHKYLFIISLFVFTYANAEETKCRECGCYKKVISLLTKQMEVDAVYMEYVREVMEELLNEEKEIADE